MKYFFYHFPITSCLKCTVNSFIHLIRSKSLLTNDFELTVPDLYYEIFLYHFSDISCLKCTVNSNFHLIRSKTLLTNDFELTVPNLYLENLICNPPGVCSFCWNFTERQILWSLCSVDFHTLTLQLPIQTPHSVAPELQVFVSSLKISAKRAHPCLYHFQTGFYMLLDEWSRNTVLLTSTQATIKGTAQYSVGDQSQLSTVRDQGCARFAEILSELTKTWSLGATECRVWIGNCNVKVWKSTEHKLHKIWRSVKFQQNEHTPVVDRTWPVPIRQ